MTASGRLRELGPPFDPTETHSWIEYDDGVTREIGSMVKLYDALPLIADVVEAAESAQRYVADARDSLDEDEMEDGEPSVTAARLMAAEIRLNPAITALREALEEK